MSKAYIFPGQGTQHPGMGRDLFEHNPKAKEYFYQANDILEFSISDIMFEGSEEDLRQTRVTQPAIFLHSVVAALTQKDFVPDMVAGHSVGEFSALVVNQTLSFEDGLTLVAQRGHAMQKACELNPSAMVAVLGLEDTVIEDVCRQIDDEVVLPANYNSPGQVVISGTQRGIEKATEKLKEAGAKRVIPLAVRGGFHSPLMKLAHDELEYAIRQTNFQQPICPIYQNVDGQPAVDIDQIKTNLIAQLTAPVKWRQSVLAMIEGGATHFIECGPGKVLQGLVKRIDRTVKVEGLT